MLQLESLVKEAKEMGRREENLRILKEIRILWENNTLYDHVQKEVGIPINKLMNIF